MCQACESDKVRQQFKPEGNGCRARACKTWFVLIWSQQLHTLLSSFPPSPLSSSHPSTSLLSAIPVCTSSRPCLDCLYSFLQPFLVRITLYSFDFIFSSLLQAHIGQGGPSPSSFLTGDTCFWGPVVDFRVCRRLSLPFLPALPPLHSPEVVNPSTCVCSVHALSWMLFLYGYVSFSLMLPLLMYLYVPHASILCRFADMSGHHCTTRRPAKVCVCHGASAHTYTLSRAFPCYVHGMPNRL